MIKNPEDILREFPIKYKPGKNPNSRLGSPFIRGHTIRNTGKTRFKKGFIPWQTGTKGLQKAPKTAFKKGQLAWNKGKKCLWVKPPMPRYGIKNNLWKGGITPLNIKIRNGLKFKKWAKLIKERDNFECQICGQKGVFLHSNHIKKFADYPDLRFETTNGITICKNCDSKWVLNREEQWESYFNFNLMVREII